MKNQKRIAFGILGAACLVVVLVVSQSILRAHQATSNSDVLHQELAATEATILTQAGKNDFLAQSHNLTQKVDAELVDLDSQIITCDPGVGGLLSATPSHGGSCVSSANETLGSIQGKYLGGQCCSPLMDTMSYHVHMSNIQAYNTMPD